MVKAKWGMTDVSDLEMNLRLDGTPENEIKSIIANVQARNAAISNKKASDLYKSYTTK